MQTLTQDQIAHLNEVLVTKLEPTQNVPAKLHTITAVTGGDINFAFKAHFGEAVLFIKTPKTQNSRITLAMFEAELRALHCIERTQTLLTPRPICTTLKDKSAFLVLEFIPIQADGDWYAYGAALAKMHRHTAPTFGFDTPNYIGATAQINTRSDHWAEFFWACRLKPQLDLCQQNQVTIASPKTLDQLKTVVDHTLAPHQPEASLVHGDLWQGNTGFTGDGMPLTFDPAAYYGDRETDIAMTTLFGAFPHSFYQGYEDVWPLPKGYAQRQRIYNLYHLLNHANLFGGSYINSCQRTLSDIIN